LVYGLVYGLGSGLLHHNYTPFSQPL
jgi:hypothetical protein